MGDQYIVLRDDEPVYHASSLKDAILYIEGKLAELRHNGYSTSGNWGKGYVAIPMDSRLPREAPSIRFDLKQVFGKWSTR